MNLSHLIRESDSGLPVDAAYEAVEIDKITDDSRQLTERSLFVASRNGAPFLEQSLQKNPAAVLVDAATRARLGDYSGIILETSNVERTQGELAASFYGHPSRELELVAVTGTNGKTSFAWMLHHLRVALGMPSAMIGTLGVRSRAADGQEQSFSTGFTTPPAPLLQKLLRELLDSGIRHVVLEASSEGLDLGRLDGCRFAAAVFTNLTRDHLDHHRTMEAYYQSKRQLFAMTARTGGRMLISVVDEWGRRLAEEFAGAETLSAADFERFPLGVSFQRQNGALAQRVLGEAAGKELSALFAALPPIPGRFTTVVPPAYARQFPASGEVAAVGPQAQLVSEQIPILGIVDYAHTPDALSALLLAVRQIPARRILCVMGCGGDRDPGKRAPMGAAAVRSADLVIVTDDNPRSEEPANIRQAILEGAYSAGLPESSSVMEVSPRRAAIARAVQLAVEESKAGAGVVVVLAGKGHEEEQIFATHRERFSDTEELLAAFARDVVL